MYDYRNGTQVPYIGSQMYQQPRQEVVRVNGDPGARAYPMGPNSSALLLDESGVIVWLVVTDGAGYKTVSPYDISPHKEPAQPDLASIEARMTRLEEIINGLANNSSATRSESAANAATVSD